MVSPFWPEGLSEDLEGTASRIGLPSEGKRIPRLQRRAINDERGINNRLQVLPITSRPRWPATEQVFPKIGKKGKYRQRPPPENREKAPNIGNGSKIVLGRFPILQRFFPMFFLFFFPFSGRRPETYSVATPISR